MSLRGEVNVVLNRLVAQGEITGFKTNFGSSEPQVGLHVIVTAKPGSDGDQIRKTVTAELERLVEAPTVSVDLTGAAESA